MQPVKMATRFLPLDRRDLQQRMVDNAQGHFFAVCVSLKLFSASSIDRYVMNEFSKALFRLVKQRHTHLWTTDDLNGYTRTACSWDEAAQSSTSTSEAT